MPFFDIKIRKSFDPWLYILHLFELYFLFSHKLETISFHKEPIRRTNLPWKCSETSSDFHPYVILFPNRKPTGACQKQLMSRWTNDFLHNKISFLTWKDKGTQYTRWINSLSEYLLVMHWNLSRKQTAFKCSYIGKTGISAYIVIATRKKR